MSAETQFDSRPPLSDEAAAVQDAIALPVDELSPEDAEQFWSLVGIVSSFSRHNPQTGEHEMISPSRIAAIPAITARHLELVRPARGDLSLAQVEEVWRGNSPANDGDRHPDQLFDIAQFNFGTDTPLGGVEREIMALELRRLELMDEFRTRVRLAQTLRRWEPRLDEDTPDDLIAERIDRLVRS